MGTRIVCLPAAVPVVAAMALVGASADASTRPGPLRDGPSGYWWGTDSNGPAPSGSASPCPSSSAPWFEPNISNNGCGRYGGYFGEIGGYWDLNNTGCSSTNAYNSTASNDAHTNAATYSDGIGRTPYWFGGGPGLDPNYDGTATEAHTWGYDQAAEAAKLASDLGVSWDFPLLWIDVEPHFGWRHVYSSCGNIVGTLASGLARDTFNGYWDYLEHDQTLYLPGVYSNHSFWDDPGGTSGMGTLSGTSEWTANWAANDNACDNPGPYDWTQTFSPSCAGFTSYSAVFFGGITSSNACAFAWQWSGGPGDYDQIDANREDSCA